MKPSFGFVAPLRCPVGCLLLAAFLVLASPANGGAASAAVSGNASPEKGTVLGIAGGRFTINRAPVFLLGFSYYGALGASEEFVRQDLTDFQEHGFNWLRVWATWEAFGEDVSGVDAAGRPREPYLGRLKRLVAECDRRGMVVDVTLTRGKGATAGRISDLAGHLQAVATLLDALRPYQNWYLDLANERDVGDARFVSAQELRRLRDRVRELDRARLVTASFGGHDLSDADIREAIQEVDVDFLAPHRPRHAGSPAETERETRRVISLMRQAGKVVPVHHQEPFRRGYTTWQPTAEDFLTDLRGAVAGGAAGWCFHNGSQRGVADEQPRRSFDLRARRLWDQLDAAEREFVTQARQAIAGAGASPKDAEVHD